MLFSLLDTLFITLQGLTEYLLKIKLTNGSIDVYLLISELELC